MNKLIEINELSEEDKKAGRAKITMSVLTIHKRGEYNKRGLTWLREYVEMQKDTIIDAPIVVSFLDEEKRIPSGHGTLSHLEDGEIYFPDSDAVGVVKEAWIDEVDIEDNIQERLIISGYIFTHRYANFYNWLKEEVNENNTRIKGSVEAVGKGDNPNIIYEHGNGHNEDGSWELGRIPVIFDFSGIALLLPEIVPPADTGSEVLEINSLNKSTDNISDDINNVFELNNNSEINKNKEDFEMEELKEQLSAKTEELNSALTELNSIKDELASSKTELNSTLDELNACKDELNACKDELKELQAKESELNELLVDANKNIESSKNTIAELNSEIEPLRAMKQDIENEKIKAEVNAYFEIIKAEDGFNATELNSLQSEYVDKCDLEGLKAKEQELCVAKFKEMRKTENLSIDTELNSVQNNELFGGLYFSTKQEVEANNDESDGSELFS